MSAWFTKAKNRTYPEGVKCGAISAWFQDRPMWADQILEHLLPGDLEVFKNHTGLQTLDRLAINGWLKEFRGKLAGGKLTPGQAELDSYLPVHTTVWAQMELEFEDIDGGFVCTKKCPSKSGGTRCTCRDWKRPIQVLYPQGVKQAQHMRWLNEKQAGFSIRQFRSLSERTDYKGKYDLFNFLMEDALDHFDAEAKAGKRSGDTEETAIKYTKAFEPKVISVVALEDIVDAKTGEFRYYRVTLHPTEMMQQGVEQAVCVSHKIDRIEL